MVVAGVEEPGGSVCKRSGPRCRMKSPPHGTGVGREGEEVLETWGGRGGHCAEWFTSNHATGPGLLCGDLTEWWSRLEEQSGLHLLLTHIYMCLVFFYFELHCGIGSVFIFKREIVSLQ